MVKVISSARAMKKRPPSMERKASSWCASNGSMAAVSSSTSAGPSAPSSTKYPRSSYWRACSRVTVRNGPLWSAQENDVFSSWTTGPDAATLISR